MGNKRRAAAQGSKKEPAKQNRPEPAEGPARAPHHEAIAVMLGCAGVLTLLSLASHNPADASLNASGSAEVRNWIGPAGAYWADLLLQILGIGAYALGAATLFAAWRALAGQRIRPGLREAGGTLLLMLCVGSFAHLLFASVEGPYPAGGVLGAILASVLVENFATVGSYILSGALVLVSLALTVDGVLAGLGLRGLSVLSAAAVRVHELWALYHERARTRRRHEAELLGAGVEAADHWTLGLAARVKQHREALSERVEKARARGRERGEAEAVREVELARARALRDVSEPEICIDRTVDLAAEEEFELGALPALDELVNAPSEPEDGVLELEPDDVEIDVPIHAAEPEIDQGPPPRPCDANAETALATEATAEPQAPPAPRRLVRSNKRTSEPEIVDKRPEVDAEAIERVAAEKIENTPKSFELPSATLLDYLAAEREPLDPAKLRDSAQKLTKTLKEHKIDGHVREIRPGPVVTMFEYVPGPGIKVSSIANRADDLAMSMEALRVRIVAPIPGKGAVGIEIPNELRETVYLKEIVASDAYRKAKSKVTVALGKDIEGNPVAVSLAKMPHLLVAGATGAGKSVSINAMIMSILFKATPDEVRMIMVDPKMLELSVYDGIPHLLLPVVTDPKKASLALRWAVEEMERRYHFLSDVGVRSIDSYNQKIDEARARGEQVVVEAAKEGEESRVCERMPYIVVIVDELADLMMVASREVEASIMRLAQMARAAGIHLVLATQRPSVDVITGVIKANFPTRIAFQVASKHDSRTIIDGNGAEHLLGAGDMLYLSPGAGGLVRIHGAYVSDEEIERTVSFLKTQGQPQYDESILAPREESAAAEADEADRDEMYDQAVAIVAETRQASISMIQRRLRIGYNRAARLVELMETEGIVGPSDGAKPREVLVSSLSL